MTTITFVRHGNTDFNVEKRAQGHLDVPLNETGRKQAALVAQRLASEKWDVLITSDLLRARETTEEISRAINMPVAAFDQRLREIDKGQIAGTIEEERIAKWGADWHKLDLGEESAEHLRKRGVKVAEDIAQTFAGKKVLVVSHGALMHQMFKALLQDDQLSVLDNTSITTLVRDEIGWKALLYNCTKHLSAVTDSRGGDYDA